MPADSTVAALHELTAAVESVGAGIGILLALLCALVFLSWGWPQSRPRLPREAVPRFTYRYLPRVGGPR